MADQDVLERLLTAELGRRSSGTTLDDLDRRIRVSRTSVPIRTRVRRRRLTALALIAMVLVVPGLVLAGRMIEPSSEAPLGLVDAAGFRAEVDVAKRTVPKPEGWPWPDYLDVAYGPGMYSRGGGQVQVETAALCLWTAEWVSARGRGEDQAATAAAQALGTMRDWALYRGPLASDSARANIDALLSATRRGDEGPARAHLSTNCATGA